MLQSWRLVGMKGSNARGLRSVEHHDCAASRNGLIGAPQLEMRSALFVLAVPRSTVDAQCLAWFLVIISTGSL
jgi:hypothetical protein